MEDGNVATTKHVNEKDEFAVQYMYLYACSTRASEMREKNDPMVAIAQTP